MANPCWKVKYESKSEAQRAMVDTIKQTGKRNGSKASAYKCKFCGKFHWGYKRIGSK